VLEVGLLESKTSEQAYSFLNQNRFLPPVFCYVSNSLNHTIFLFIFKHSANCKPVSSHERITPFRLHAVFWCVNRLHRRFWFMGTNHFCNSSRGLYRFRPLWYGFVTKPSGLFFIEFHSAIFCLVPTCALYLRAWVFNRRCFASSECSAIFYSTWCICGNGDRSLKVTSPGYRG
jgi:hypothetical protein